MDNVTPETLYKELSKTVIGQEGYLNPSAMPPGFTTCATGIISIRGRR